MEAGETLPDVLVAFVRRAGDDERKRWSQMPMMYWYGYGWGGALFMVLSMLLWVGVVALVIWALIRWLAPAARGTGMPGPGSVQPSALEILRQRYARGELDTATFEAMRERLEGDASPRREPAGSR